jgi:hypothetical protein
MGSALCFPIESYVFSMVAEAAYRIHHGKASQGYRNGISVYGDDIIIPAELYQLTVSILEELGFVVNASKSFNSGPYYESCGVEYLNGIAVRTIKHPRKHLFCQNSVSPEAVGMVTDLANSLTNLGYFQCRRFLLKYYASKVVTIGSRAVPFMDLMIFDQNNCRPVEDTYVDTEWDSNIQRSVIRRRSIRTAQSSAPSDLIEWLHRHPRRDRKTRVRELYYHARSVDVQPLFSRKAVISLSKMGFFTILEGEDVEAIVPARTGRSRLYLKTTRVVAKPSR